jgi:hypothetical protein
VSCDCLSFLLHAYDCWNISVLEGSGSSCATDKENV